MRGINVLGFWQGRHIMIKGGVILIVVIDRKADK
jgi:hypothetical protein